jgi:hypothetical protein
MTYAEYERKMPPQHPTEVHRALDNELTDIQVTLLQTQERIHGHMVRMMRLRNALREAAGE